jgi:hypothetical protein
MTVLFYAAAALYPLFVFFGLVLFKFPVRAVSLAIAASGLFVFVLMTSRGAKKKGRFRP